MYAGKILGAMAGLGVGLALGSAWVGVILALVGAVVGHTVDPRSEDVRAPLPDAASLDAPPLLPVGEPRSRAELERESRDYFAENVAALFAQALGPEGKSSEARSRAARFLQAKLGFGPADVLSLVDINPGPLRSGADAAHLCQEELSPPARMLLLDALYALASEAGALTSSTRERLAGTGQALGLSEAEHASVSRLYIAGRESDYVLLGVSPHATDDEVKRAFRKLAIAHHPDKVNHLGGTAVFRASETFRAIREAYESILAARRQ